MGKHRVGKDVGAGVPACIPGYLHMFFHCICGLLGPCLEPALLLCAIPSDIPFAATGLARHQPGPLASWNRFVPTLGLEARHACIGVLPVCNSAHKHNACTVSVLHCACLSCPLACPVCLNNCRAHGRVRPFVLLSCSPVWHCAIQSAFFVSFWLLRSLGITRPAGWHTCKWL